LHPPIDGVGQVRPASPTATPIRAVPRRARPARPEPWSDALPFAGLRVADFTSFWAGPFLTHTLAMFGADVIHVESTVRPDGSRLMTQHPASVAQWWERSSCFHGTNTNKRGLTLDLSQDEGRALARRLVGVCHVVVENYSPRVMDSWGLSWDDVRSLRPDALMVRMPAFGLSGPWRDRTGFAMTMEQVSGMAWMCGFPEHAPAALFGPCDPSAGLHALVGLLAALEHRRTTGEGRLVEAPMVAGALHVAAELVIQHSATGVRLDRDGNRGPAAAPQNCYPAADVDAHGGARWIALAVATDEQWQALRRVLGDPHWAADPALAAHAGRRAHHELLDREIGAWCAARPAEEIVRALRDAGVPAERVLLPADHLDLAQLLHRRFFEHVEHPVHGDSVHTTFPFRLPGWEGPVHRRPAPLLGQDNATILGDLLGVSDDELRGLEARRVIGTAL
jgi:crotonobetainyl-CoA:carnitine CoA-transferase CaiB-like acyl-CoA transferase